MDNKTKGEKKKEQIESWKIEKEKTKGRERVEIWKIDWKGNERGRWDTKAGKKGWKC